MLSLSSPSLFQRYFRQFYSYFGANFESHCQQQIQIYHNSTSQTAINDSCYNVINCLVQSLDARGQLLLAVTTVSLGLAPTILSILGSNTVETALLISKRPLLGFLLSLGAPVITPIRAFEQVDPRNFLLIPALERWSPPLLKPLTERLVCLIEYTLVLAALTNVTYIALELAFMSFPISTECNQRWEYLLWVYIASLPHIFGLAAFATRAKWPRSLNQAKISRFRIINALSRWFKDEFKPCRQRERHAF